MIRSSFYIAVVVILLWVADTSLPIFFVIRQWVIKDSFCPASVNDSPTWQERCILLYHVTFNATKAIYFSVQIRFTISVSSMVRLSDRLVRSEYPGGKFHPVSFASYRYFLLEIIDKGGLIFTFYLSKNIFFRHFWLSSYAIKLLEQLGGKAILSSWWYFPTHRLVFWSLSGMLMSCWVFQWPTEASKKQHFTPPALYLCGTSVY